MLSPSGRACCPCARDHLRTCLCTAPRRDPRHTHSAWAGAPQTCALKAKRAMENFHLYSLPHHFPGLPWVRPVEIHQARSGETLSWLKSPLPSKLGTWLLCSLGLRYRAQDPTEATSREAVGKPPSFCEPQFPHVCSTVSLQSSKDRALFSMSCCCSFAKLYLILYDPMDPKQHARLPRP